MKKKKPFKIVVMGTRGKSSLIRLIHLFLSANGYSVLSRETGLFPVLYNNLQRIFLLRAGVIPWSRIMELPVLKKLFPFKNYDFVIFENNSISEEYMRYFHRMFEPDLAFIVTVSLDHIYDQGGDFLEVSQAFLNSIQKETSVVFWTNHQDEQFAFEAVARRMKRPIQSHYCSYSRRDRLMIKLLKQELELRGYEFTDSDYKVPETKKDDNISKIHNRKIVNLAHINDLVHTVLALDSTLKRQHKKKFYVLLNLRSDRPERFLIYTLPFLKFYKDQIKGMFIHTDSMIFDFNQVTKEIKKEAKHIKTWEVKDAGEFIENLRSRTRPDEMIVMVGNTADEFGFKLIGECNLFEETYPILPELVRSAKLD